MQKSVFLDKISSFKKMSDSSVKISFLYTHSHQKL